jgi:hypothetical protein
LHSSSSRQVLRAFSCLGPGPTTTSRCRRRRAAYSTNAPRCVAAGCTLSPCTRSRRAGRSGAGRRGRARRVGVGGPRRHHVVRGPAVGVRLPGPGDGGLPLPPLPQQPWRSRGGGARRLDLRQLEKQGRGGGAPQVGVPTPQSPSPTDLLQLGGAPPLQRHAAGPPPILLQAPSRQRGATAGDDDERVELRQQQIEFTASSLPQHNRSRTARGRPQRGSSPTGEAGEAPAADLLTTELDPPSLFSPLFLFVSDGGGRVSGEHDGAAPPVVGGVGTTTATSS